MPKVSILVPVYNVEDYLAECLDSLIAQTLNDIEIVCVNDGSTDNSAAILEEYAEKDSRIIIVTKENGGLPSARNAGLDAATGDYVGFVDSDDFIEPNMYERLYETAINNNSEIVICGANVFPIDPAPSQWLIDVLSPNNITYKEFTPDIIFKENAARPFIWRTFVKRNLFEREHIRLNESIHIGEDNALQFRIYPKAKGVTLISDKLYNYRWYRQNSLMNNIVYKDITKKLKSHADLILHIANEWEKSGKEKDLMNVEFLKWSCEFLYDDFIKLPLNDRISVSKKLTSMWTEYGYYSYRKNMPSYIQDMFKYFYDASLENEINPKVSIVVYVSENPFFLRETFESIKNQDLKEIEIIMLNAGASNSAFEIMFKLIHSDKRFRLYNMPPQCEADALNNGIAIAKGEYIAFVKANDCLTANAANIWYEEAVSSHSDVCASLYEERDAINYEPVKRNLSSKISSDEINTYYLDSDFHSCLYRTDFVQEKKILFKDYSILTGKCFITKCYNSASKKSMISNALYIHRIQYKKDWIPTNECFLVLDCISTLMKIAVKNRDTHLYAKAYSLICSDYLTNMIINNTLAFWGYKETFPNGENSQAEAWAYLMEIAGMIDYDMLADALPEDAYVTYPVTLRVFVEKRHEFLTDLSNKYRQLF